MHAIDLQHHTGELFGGVATVTRDTEGGYVLAAGAERYTAKRARSCLLEPRTGDLVLFGGVPTGALYVLAVLEREDGTTEIAVEGDLSIRATGACAVAAQDGVQLASAGTVSVASEAIEVRARRGEIFFDRLAYVGRRVRAEVERISTVASVVDQLLGSVRERVQRSYRTVEEMDHVRAGSIDVAARENVRMHARHTLVTAEAIVKVNGQQIHLG